MSGGVEPWCLRTRISPFPPTRRRLLMLVVVERLPETNPNIEQSQTAAEATEETIGHHGAESGKRKQQIVISPFRGPRKNDEQPARHRTDQNKKKHRNAMHPDLHRAMRLVSISFEKRSARFSVLRNGFVCLVWSTGKRSRFGHRGLRENKPRRSTPLALDPEGGK